MYGVAALNCWGTETSRTLLETYYESRYKPLLLAAPNPQSGDDSDDPDASQLHYSSIRRGTEMARAMDKLNAVIMSLKGISPQEAAKREEKRMEEQQQIAQRASQSKVMEWMRTVEDGGS
jgi:hypothetical protein